MPPTRTTPSSDPPIRPRTASTAPAPDAIQVPAILISPSSPEQLYAGASPNPAAQGPAQTGVYGQARRQPTSFAAGFDEARVGQQRSAPPPAAAGAHVSPRSPSPTDSPSSTSNAPLPFSVPRPHAAPSASAAAGRTPSQSQAFFASLASALPSLPSFPSLNLSALLPSKLPGAPSMRKGSWDGSTSGESDASDDGDEADRERDDGEREGRAEEGKDGGRRSSEEIGRHSMDLRIEQATTGATFVSDSPVPTPFSTPSASSPVPASPSFSPLARAPSSAFVAASASGRVHPLTLQAIARRDSEQEALKVVKAREETERRRENSAEETEGGGGAGGGSGQPKLLRKQSWARTNNGGAAGSRAPQGRSESPTQLSEHESSSASASASVPARTAAARSIGKALSQVREEGGGAVGSAGERARQTSADTIVPRLRPRPATAGAGPPPSSSSASSPLRPVEMRARTVSTASTVAPAIDGAKPKRTKSLFARFVRSSKGGSKAMGRTETVASGVSVGEFGESRESTEGRESWGGLNSLATERSSTKAGPVEKIRYAKVKAKGKSTKDFNKLFLAQELVIPRPPRPAPRPASFHEGDGDSTYSTDASIHSHSHSHSTAGHDESSTDHATRKKQNAVWAVKFSDDGRYLAVGGKDGVVRVWEVLSTPEARQSAMHPPSSPFPLSSDDTSVPATPSSDSPPLTRSQTFSSAPANGGSSGRKKGKDKEKTPVAIMPVFGSRPLWEFRGHEADVLDLSWSKNNFLLSSSMDKTVRLWHVSRSECLCAFQHLDFVTSIAFHPKDDRFFLSGSLDCKLRLWNIPEKRVHIWTELPELITSVAFTRDGKLAIAGSFVGICMFFEVETFRYHAQFAAKSTRGKNSKGKKITSLCPFPLPSTGGERLLVTSNDSRMRLYHTMDKMVEVKYAGHENTSSQIRASFSDDGRWVISGSEDRHVYIWDSGLTPKADGGFHLLKKSGKEGTGYESFAMSAHIVTAAIFAPTRTRALLASAGDPVFSDGHTHLAPLQQTISGASLAEMETRASTAETSEGGGRMVPATSREFGGAEDAIVIVADDETGVISIFRNSPVPLSALSPVPPHSAMSSTSGFKNGGGHASPSASTSTNYKRLSRASEMSVKSR